MEDFLSRAVSVLISAGGKLAVSLLVYFVGRLIIKKILSLFEREKLAEKMDLTTRKFLSSLTKVVLYIVLVISIVGILGVPMASVITVLATAGAAVGLALQGSLSNLAGGIMLMIFRPFSVGDYVTAGGESGTVKEISLFYTKLTTVDNKEITIPNGTLMNSTVTNYSAEPLRRVDVDFSCARSEDIEKVRGILSGVLAEDPRILEDPAPFARLTGATNESLVFTARAWVKNEDYWDVYMDVTQKVSEAFATAGVQGPGVRVVSEQKAQAASPAA